MFHTARMQVDAAWAGLQEQVIKKAVRLGLDMVYKGVCLRSWLQKCGYAQTFANGWREILKKTGSRLAKEVKAMKRGTEEGNNNR